MEKKVVHDKIKKGLEYLKETDVSCFKNNTKLYISFINMVLTSRNCETLSQDQMRAMIDYKPTSVLRFKIHYHGSTQHQKNKEAQVKDFFGNRINEHSKAY